MARLFAIPILLALIPEGILAFAMVAGIVWLHHVIYGFIFMFGAALLMALPFLGELRLDFDSVGPRVSGKIGWWGRFLFRGGTPAELQVRFLGLPYRRRIAAKPAPKRPEKPKANMKQWALENKVNLSRLLLAGLQSGNEFLWESHAFAVTGNAPTGIDIVDQLISGLVGHRLLGPIDIAALPEGPARRMRFTYRIGLADALFVGLFALLQGRPIALALSLRKAQRRAAETRREIAQAERAVVRPPVPRARPPEEEERRAA